MIKSAVRATVTAALMLAPLAAHGADLGGRYAPPPSYLMPAPANANWNGLYVGVNGGYGFGTSTWNPAIAGGNPNPKGFVGGLTLGYNYQTGSLVWGIEGDVDYSTMKASAACGAATCDVRNNWLATERARLGFAGWTNWLPYVTAGLAFGDIKASDSLGASSRATKFGWTAGAGVEYALWSYWSVKAEYLYVDLGSTSCDSGCGALTGESVGFKASLVRAGVNYRF